jgi:hypothetical protein
LVEKYSKIPNYFIAYDIEVVPIISSLVILLGGGFEMTVLRI